MVVSFVGVAVDQVGRKERREGGREGGRVLKWLCQLWGLLLTW